MFIEWSHASRVRPLSGTTVKKFVGQIATQKGRDERILAGTYHDLLIENCLVADNSAELPVVKTTHDLYGATIIQTHRHCLGKPKRQFQQKQLAILLQCQY